MFGQRSVFDNDSSLSRPFEDAEKTLFGHHFPLRDHRHRASQFENVFAPQPRREEDIPLPSIEGDAFIHERLVDMSVTPEPIEVENINRERSVGMFITPEPHGRREFPIYLPDSPGSIYQSNSHDMQFVENDCMIVDESECSTEALKKWASSKQNKKMPFKDTVFKKEPELEKPRSSGVLGIQKQLISQHRASKKRKHGASELSGWTYPVEVSPTKPKPRRSSNRQQMTLDNFANAKVEFETLMRRGEENSEWREPSDNETGESDEIENLRRLRRYLEKRKEAKHLTEAETIELMKLNQRIELHSRRRQAVDRLNQQELMSSDDRREESELQIRLGMDHQAIEEEESAKKGGRKSAKGNGRRVARTAREVAENRREKAREKEQKKRARIAISKKGPSKGKGSKRGGRATALTEHKSRMKMTQDDGRATLGALLQGLVHNDFIADRQALGEFPEAPKIRETRKDKALHALLASVPNDYDTHRAKTDKSDLNKASKNFGFGRVKFDNGGWKLKGMKSHLYHHQLIGADWMLSRELAVEKPHGGLLADAMGLGKTLQILATMVGNPPGTNELKQRQKATLIVIPASAIQQWHDEIDTHVESGTFPRIIRFKAKHKTPLVLLQDCDIVLASYAEVMNSCPWPGAEEIKEICKNGGLENWMKECPEPVGDLHKIDWYRVVLDEAHAIKNFKSRTSIACQHLTAKYRWALSGTPIQNRLDELFPYLHFLRAPWTENRDLFRAYFCDPDAADANTRVKVVLSIVMMRRTMMDKMLGRPIVELPPIHPETHFISFSKEEGILYRILEDRFRHNINEHFEQGTAGRNYALWMVQVLRLRQCTSHPFLLESTVKEIFTYEDTLRLKEEWKRLSRNKQPLYEQIQQWVQQTEEERMAAQAKGEPTLGPGEKQAFGKSDFGKYFRMETILDSLDSKELVKRVVCRICGDLPEDPLITDCHHVFCRTCLENYLNAEALREKNFKYNQCPEPSCRRVFKEAIPFEDPNNTGDGDVNTDDSGDQPRNNKSRKRVERGSDDDLYSGSSSWFDMCMKTDDKYLPPSAKTIALKAKILNWMNEAPQDKILIFTQWKVMAKIIGAICTQENWSHLYFTGDMNLEQRHASVKRFRSDSSYKIMIASLKCGGQALNLTCANRVISIDLWWNHSIEQQAFGRVFRIGQHKETYVSRLVIKNTVDKRLLNMQADKIRTIDRAMQDTDTDLVEPLSIADLASLFGHLRESEDGKWRVESDYEGDEDGDDEPEGSALGDERMQA